jgi:hypothetical protein
MLMRPTLFTPLSLILVTMSSMPAATHARGVHPNKENEYGDPKPVIL